MADAGVKSTNLSNRVPLIDEIIGNRAGSTGLQAVSDLNTQLAATGAIASEFQSVRDDLVKGLITEANWAGLSVRTSTVDGAGAQVLDADTGTHPAATSTGYNGAGVPNGGRYKWNLAWARWVRIGDNYLAPATTAQALAGDRDDRAITPLTNKAALDARAGPGGTLIDTASERYLRGQRLIGEMVDPNGRSVFAIREDGYVFGKLAMGVGVSNGLTWGQDSDGFWRIGLGSADGLLPLTGTGDVIDTRATRYYDGKKVVYEVTFQGGELALAIAEDGTVYIPKSNISVNLSSVSDQIAALQTSVALLRPSREFAFYGDSLTAGDIPSRFALLSGRVTYNRGIGGQTSNQIAQRQGGNVPRVTISGNQITAGANTITAFNTVAVTGMATTNAADQFLSTASGNGTQSAKATIANIIGTVTRSASGGPPSTSETYTFTPDAGQTLPVTCPPQTPMIVDVAGDDRRTCVFWPGRNNDWSTTQIEQDVDAMVSRLATAEKRFVIMSILNGEYASEYAGAARYIQLTTRNGNLQAKYPNNFLDIRRYLIDRGLADAGITPTAQDTTDISRDIVPVSLRDDNIHLNATARQLVAARLETYRAAKGW